MVGHGSVLSSSVRCGVGVLADAVLPRSAPPAVVPPDLLLPVVGAVRPVEDMAVCVGETDGPAGVPVIIPVRPTTTPNAKTATVPTAMPIRGQTPMRGRFGGPAAEFGAEPPGGPVDKPCEAPGVGPAGEPGDAPDAGPDAEPDAEPSSRPQSSDEDASGWSPPTTNTSGSGGRDSSSLRNPPTGPPYRPRPPPPDDHELWGIRSGIRNKRHTTGDHPERGQ